MGRGDREGGNSKAGLKLRYVDKGKSDDRIALALHVLGAVVWVGGMFAAYMCLRPPPARSSRRRG